MSIEFFINIYLDSVVQPAPSDSSYNRMQVIAIGPAIPSQQTTIFQIIESSNELRLTRKKLSITYKQIDQCIVHSGHTKSSNGMQHRSCLFIQSQQSKRQNMGFHLHHRQMER